MHRSTSRRVARPRTSAVRAFALVAAAALALSACGGQDGGGEDGGGEDDADASAAADGDGDGDAISAEQPLAVVIASYDLAVGEDRRLMAGVLTADAVPVAFGEVTFELGYLGEEPSGEASLDDEVTASYLPVLGLEPEVEPTEQPTVLVGEGGTGVYEAAVTFEEPGFYGLRVTAELEDGTTREGQVTFPVLPEHEVVDVGEEAPRSQNLTIADVEAGDAEPITVDSRAMEEGAEVPDTHLHDTTIADALDEGRPVVVIVSTPTFCVSAFCGPLTAEMATLAESYEPEVDFIHLEVWRNFEEQQLNEAAAEWIQTSSGGNEPWVFLVDGDGIVQGRWDNVVNVAELESRIQDL